MAGATASSPGSVTEHQNPQVLVDFLNRNPSIQFIRLQWLDYSNMLRGRVLTKHFVLDLVQSSKLYAVGVGFLTLLEDSNRQLQLDPSEAVGSCPVIPDWPSLRVCPWSKGHACVQCFIGKAQAVSKDENHNHPAFDELCPRSILQSAIHAAKAIGLDLQVGFETEFCISQLTADGSATGLPQGTHHHPSSMRTLERTMLPILDEIVLALEAAGIPVLVYHAEGQRDQYEVVTKQLPPMQAADAVVFTREAIRNICWKHSLLATFHPWTPVTNGAHVNVSIVGNQALEDRVEDGFLAGLLEHLCAIFAFGLPLPVSYKRVAPGRQAFGEYVAWGTQNRETPVRRKGKGFWELRFVDAAAQVYLLLAAVIRAGKVGVEQRMELTWKDCQVDPQVASPGERFRLGIARKLPSELHDAHARLLEDRILRDELGPRVVETYTQLMNRLADTLRDVGEMDSDAQRAFLSTRL